MQQYIIRKGAEADSFFVILRGEAQECVKLMLNESAEMRYGRKCYPAPLSRSCGIDMVPRVGIARNCAPTAWANN